MAHDVLLLDLDDTLYAYDPCREAGKRGAHERAKELGYEMDRDAFDAFYDAGREAVKQDIACTGSSHERYLYFKRALELHTGTHRSQHAFELGRAFWESYMDEMELFPGVMETLERFSDAGIRTAITTDLTTRTQLQKVSRLGIDEHIDVMVTSEEVGRDKPARAMFAIPLARLGATPDEAVMVGDSVSSDIVGGNAVGLTTALFNNDERPDEARKRPDHRLDAFDDLLDILEVEDGA